MIKQICVICNKEFFTYYSRLKIGKGIYCSHDCYSQSLVRKFIPKKKCIKCGDKFSRPSKYSNDQWNSRNYCSQSCGKLGNKISNETKIKLSIFNKGKKLSAETKKRIGDGQRGNKNHWWKGDKVGYFSLHSWLKRNYGKSKQCEHCGTIKAKKYEWANISGKYIRDRKDFMQLCTKCHRNFDNKRWQEEERRKEKECL